MINAFKMALKYFVLFITYGVIYYCIEIIYRNYSDISMLLLGGICGVIIGSLNEYFSWEMPFWFQCFKGAIIITALEFVAGVILNMWLGLNIWDYSHIWGNILGQVCIPFTVAWFFLSGVAIVLDDWLRYWLFKEEKPHYKWI